MSNIRCMYLSGLSGTIPSRPNWEKNKDAYVRQYGIYCQGWPETDPERIKKKKEEYAYKCFLQRYPVEKGYDRFERFLQRASTEFKDDYFMFITALAQSDLLDRQIKKYGLEDQLFYKSKQQVFNHMHAGGGRRLCMYIFKFNKEFHFE